MAKVPAISEAEWEVMRVLWETASPLSGNEVVERVSDNRPGWSPQTIKTMLNRLVKKGALAYEEQGKHYLYRPKVARQACVRSESRSFLQRVFGGAVGPMLNHFVQDAKLSDSEIAELKRLLEEKGR